MMLTLKTGRWAALVAVGMLAAQAMAGDIDGTPWDREYDCLVPGDDLTQGAAVADLTAAGWSWSSPGWGRIAWNSKFSPTAQVGLDWWTAQGNPGSAIYIAPYNGLTKAAGWTFEWKMVGNSFDQTVQNVQLISDDTSAVSVSYARTAAALTVTINDLKAGGLSDSVDLGPGYLVTDRNVGYHTYRLIRQAGSSTIELYVDNDFSSPAAQISVQTIVGDPGMLNRVYPIATSVYEAAYHFWGVHSGAVIPEPATMLVLGVGGALTLLGRRRRS